MVTQKRWASLSTNEKIEALREEVKSNQSNTRSLKKIVTDLIARVGEMRRYLGMNHVT